MVAKPSYHKFIATVIDLKYMPRTNNVGVT